MSNCNCERKNYEEEVKEIKDCTEEYVDEGYTGIGKLMAVLEYAQWIDKIDYSAAKEILYRFIEDMFHPDWD